MKVLITDLEANNKVTVASTGIKAYDDTVVVGRLDGLDAATTPAALKTAYESNANTNAYTDTEQTKLGGIEVGATADQTKADIDALLIDAATIDGLDSTAFEPADPTILKDADIGVNVAAQVHNHDAAYISVVSTPTLGNFPQLTAGGELVNSTYDETSFATAAHVHTGVYEPADSTILKDADIGATVQAYDAATAKTNVTQTFTAPQRFNITAEDNAIDFTAGGNHFELTATAANITALNPATAIGQSGKIVIHSAENITGWGVEYKFKTAPVGLTGTEVFDYVVINATSIYIGVMT